MDENTRIVTYIKALYQVIWLTWFHDHATATPATVIVEFADGDDCYDWKTHQLYLRISEANRDDVLQAISSDFNHRCQPADWAGWYISLIHEMTHEYQFRSLNDTATPEGQSLFDDPPKKWRDPGHGVGFYSAIVNRAAYFGLDPAKFCQYL